jgi:hypothetical protein
MDITLQTNNNIDIALTPQQPVQVNVTPAPTQTLNISRGVAGPPGPNTIIGYPIVGTGAVQNYDALMFRSTLGAWTNINQTEISDGGNF